MDYSFFFGGNKSEKDSNVCLSSHPIFKPSNNIQTNAKFLRSMQNFYERMWKILFKNKYFFSIPYIKTG